MTAKAATTCARAGTRPVGADPEALGGGAGVPLVQGVLGGRHRLSQGATGVRLQVSGALLARLLRRLWVNRPPPTSTDERRCCSRSSWAREAEWFAPLDRWHLNAPLASKS
jgi:hypothetical protein